MTTPTTERATQESTGDLAEPRPPLEPDERFHLLQTERRRSVIEYLRDAETDDDGHVWMRDIAEQVAAWENDTSVAQLSSTERQRVYIPLYQNHLPKLDEAGVIEYNQSRGTVTPTDRVDELAEYLDDPDAATGDDAADDAWYNYYLGASGVGAVMLGGAALSLLPGFLVAVTILALFSTVSVSQYQRQAGSTEA